MITCGWCEEEAKYDVEGSNVCETHIGDFYMNECSCCGQSTTKFYRSHNGRYPAAVCLTCFKEDAKFED